MWPPNWFARVKALYPRKEAWGRAEKVLERLRKTGKLAFDDLMAGIERLIAQNRAREYTPLLATWLNDRGWEDEQAAALHAAPARLSDQPPPRRAGDPLAEAFRMVQDRMDPS